MTEINSIANQKTLYYKLKHVSRHAFFVPGMAYIEVVSAKTIYNYIDLKIIDLINFYLLRKVSLNHRKQKPNANVMILGKSFELRPEYINDRSEFGHWEIDTVIGIQDKNDQYY